MKTLLLIFFSLFSLPMLAQEVSNVQVRQEVDELIVTFDISGTAEEYLVEIAFSEDGNQFRQLGKMNGRKGKNMFKEILKAPVFIPSGIFKVTAQDPYSPELVFVEGGFFEMGSNDGGSDERPVHRVQLSDYFIGKYEVTQQQWKLVMGSNPSYFKYCADCPVEQVSWDDVQEFLQKLSGKTGKSFRLPSEAEWEYAARGGNKSAGYNYSGSNDINEVAWYSSNGDGKTHPVGQKQPNELGIYDMSGNVWEWCSDWYDPKYYVSSAGSNPLGAGGGHSRVSRGGSWANFPVYCRVAYRSGSQPERQNAILGFRLALPSR